MPSPSTSATELDDRIATLRAELAGIVEQRSAAIVAGDAAAADHLDAEAVRRERAIRAAEAARLAVNEAAVALADEAEEVRARRERENLKGLARTARERAAALNDAIDQVAAATMAVREATRALWEASDGPTRREGLGELPRLLSDLPMVTHERLAHGGVLASRSAAFDRSAPAPSVEAHLDIAIALIAPGPGRPHKATKA